MDLESGVKKTWFCILREWGSLGQLRIGHSYSSSPRNECRSAVYVQGQEAADEIRRLSTLNERTGLLFQFLLWDVFGSLRYIYSRRTKDASVLRE